MSLPPTPLLPPGVEASSSGHPAVASQPPNSQARSRTINTAHHDRIEKTRRTSKGMKLRRRAPVSSEDSPPGPTTPMNTQVQEQAFRFLDLPGEIRNKVYEYTTACSRQALLVHLPRRMTLRRRLAPTNPKRVTQRPFHGLTQVCRQIRVEYRPLYLMAQEIGLDITEANKYLSTFYGSDPTDTAVGNITVAISGKVSKTEMGDKGIDVWPMLDVWANSRHIEAGFGRYSCKAYDSAGDGEAKDLYRLFGRYVLPGRKCSRMNGAWRAALRGRHLAEVRIHRMPKFPTRPFFHILYKPAFAEPWMDNEDCNPHMRMYWFRKHGFERMEYFQIRIGISTMTDAEGQHEAGRAEETSSESSNSDNN